MILEICARASSVAVKAEYQSLEGISFVVIMMSTPMLHNCFVNYQYQSDSFYLSFCLHLWFDFCGLPWHSTYSKS
jgi:hypothetical protein